MMRGVLPAIALPLLSCGLLLASLSPAPAQDARAGTGIAVVDIPGILRESSAGRAARGQVETIAAGTRESLAALETELLQADQDLEQQRTILAPDVYARKREELRQRVVLLERRARQEQDRLEQAFGVAMRRVQDILVEEISIMAQERGVFLVLQHTQIVVVDTALDMTADALVRLDARVPSVEVVLDAAAAE